MTSYTDDFARGGGAELVGTGPGWQGTAGLWTTATAGVAQRAGANATTAVATVGPTDTDDMTVTATLTRLGGANTAGIIARAAAAGSGADCYAFRATGTSWILNKIVGGVITPLATVATPVRANGDVISLSCIGSAITASVNGVAVASVTDTSITAGRYGGLRATSAATPPQFDNFTAADTAAPFAVLTRSGRLPVGITPRGDRRKVVLARGRLPVDITPRGPRVKVAFARGRIGLDVAPAGHPLAVAPRSGRLLVAVGTTAAGTETDLVAGRVGMAVRLRASHVAVHTRTARLPVRVSPAARAFRILERRAVLGVGIRVDGAWLRLLERLGRVGVVLDPGAWWREAPPGRDVEIDVGELSARILDAHLEARTLDARLEARTLTVRLLGDPMKMTRADVIYLHIPVTATLVDGAPAAPEGVEVALLPLRSSPDADTSWVPVDLVDGTARVLVSGSAGEEGALPVPGFGAEVYVRVVDTPERQARRAGRITLE